MKKWSALTALVLVAAAACAGDGNSADSDLQAGGTAAMAEQADATETGETGMAETSEVQASGLLNLNDATADELRSAGVSDAAVSAITGGRPFENMLAADAALAGVLDEAGREALYRKAWIPFDLNSVSREEILLVPGVGDRMAHEFEEYRPYTAMAQFRREIGKYVDDAEVERLAQYVTVN